MTPYYQRAGITLYHADCRDVLPGLPQGRTTGEGIDLLLTDPPYGVEASSGSGRRKPLALPGIANDRPEDADLVREGVALAWQCVRPHRHAYVFGRFDLSALPLCGATCELVRDLLASFCDPEGGGGKGGLVLDPYAGSGTTLLAAMERALPAIGCERREVACEIAARRLEAYALQGALFGERA